MLAQPDRKCRDVEWKAWRLRQIGDECAKQQKKILKLLQNVTRFAWSTISL
jgi:hypothetical protein